MSSSFDSKANGRQGRPGRRGRYTERGGMLIPWYPSRIKAVSAWEEWPSDLMYHKFLSSNLEDVLDRFIDRRRRSKSF